MDIRQNVQYLKGVGPKKAQALKKLGIENIYDLATYYPRRYEDLSSVQPIGSLKPGDTANIQGKIVAMADRNTRRGLKLLTVMMADDTGNIQINFFNQDYLKKKFKQGMRLFVHGKIGYAYGGYGQLAVTQLISFDTEDGESGKEAENHYAFIPVYTLPDYIKPKDFRNLLEQVMAAETNFKDIVPEFIRAKYQLLSKREAVGKIHFPQSKKELEEAKRSLIFEELFSIQAGLLLLKKQHTGRERGIKFLPNSKLVEAVFKAIPFELTAEQQDLDNHQAAVHQDGGFAHRHGKNHAEHIGNAGYRRGAQPSLNGKGNAKRHNKQTYQQGQITADQIVYGAIFHVGLFLS